MNLKLYDFDGTIYNGDSSVDFFLYVLIRKPSLIKYVFKMIPKAIKYISKRITITEFKETVFSYLNDIEDVDKLVISFWEKKSKKIKDFYLNDSNRDNHIIISASPEFLLEPICFALGVKDLIASDVNKKTGKFNKPNCRGEEKVKRLKEKYPNAVIMEMYSDSMHDKPLLDLAPKSYFVKKNKIYDYRAYKPSMTRKIWNFKLKVYNSNEEIWNYIIAAILTTIISVLSYTLFTKVFGIHYIVSNTLSWILAVLFTYSANRLFVFRSQKENRLKELMIFTSSRLITLLMDTLMMVLFVSLLNVNDLIAKTVVQIIVVIINYQISKFIVFK